MDAGADPFETILAAKDAEIERLQRDLGLAAQHAAAADAECERRIAAHQAAEVEVAHIRDAHEQASRWAKRARAAEAEVAREKAHHEGTILHIEAITAAAIAPERERCARVADEWLAPPTMKLRAGEMTAQEVRTAKAVVTAIADAIRAG